MKVKVGDVYKMTEGISHLMDKNLNSKLAFRVGRNYKKLSEEVRTAEETRDKIKFEEGTEEYDKEVDALFDEEVDIKLSYIYLHELQEVKPRTLVLLEKIIKEGKNEDNDK